jgi:hypothetical protein
MLEVPSRLLHGRQSWLRETLAATGQMLELELHRAVAQGTVAFTENAGIGHQKVSDPVARRYCRSRPHCSSRSKSLFSKSRSMEYRA